MLHGMISLVEHNPHRRHPTPDFRGRAEGKKGGKGARIMGIKGGLISRWELAFSSISWRANFVQPIFVSVGLNCMTFSNIFRLRRANLTTFITLNKSYTLKTGCTYVSYSTSNCKSHVV